ncbi:MAG: carbohydrate kinase family protein [bacterium]
MIFGKKKLNIVSIGDIAVDAFIRIKETSDTCSIDTENCKICLNLANKIPYEFDEVVPAVGNSANAAVSFSKLGFNSSLVANVGKDRYGTECTNTLKKLGVNVGHVASHKDKRTNYHYVLWCGPERTILVKHEEFPYSLPKIKNPDWIYLSSLGGNSLDYHHQIAEYLSKNKEVKLAFQPGTFQMKLGTEVLKKIYERTEIFICNVEEAELITNTKTKDIKELSEKLHALGPKIVVLTDGPQGSYSYDGTKLLFIEAYPQEPAYERTGAGDAYSSTFVGSIAHGETIENSMKLASVNSMNVCKYIGSQKGLLTLKDIKTYLDNAPKSWQPKEI